METIRDNAAYLPDRLNEDWRFGRPHVHAAFLSELLSGGKTLGSELSVSGGAVQQQNSEPLRPEEFASIGSEYLVRQALAGQGKALCLRVDRDSDAENPLRICCEVEHDLQVGLRVVIEPGVRAHIVEEHRHHGSSALMCLRHYEVMPGASLTLELREKGSGESSALNITQLTCLGDARVRCISSHSNHAWAREESTAVLTPQAGAAPELLMLSANYLMGEQWLDQRTRQLHMGPGGKSRLLYKNVVEGKATAVFGGNIRVETGAHDTDAYLSNLNMTLSEHATVHSLPGLEILADRVRCSHGSATAPMDEEQLFYLLSRGIDEMVARRMLAEGFLADVWERFNEGLH